MNKYKNIQNNKILKDKKIKNKIINRIKSYIIKINKDKKKEDF